MNSQTSLLVFSCFLCFLGCSQKKKTFPVLEKPTTFKISLPTASLDAEVGFAQFSSASTLEAPSNLPLEITGRVDVSEGLSPQAIMEICKDSLVVDSHYLNIDQDNSFRIRSVALQKGSYHLKVNFVQHNTKAILGLNIK